MPYLAFALAAALAALAGTLLAGAAERLTRAELDQALAEARLNWVQVQVDGLTAHLSGAAPSEAARLGALRTAGAVVGAGRLTDSIALPRAQGSVAPVFRVEAMRHHDDLSLIGLVPGAMGEDGLVARLAAIGPAVEVADMLQTADHPMPPGWTLAVDFAVEALRRLDIAQVSVTAGRVEVHALVDSPDDRQRLTTELRALAPRGQVLVLDLVAPRPVIAPFLLRLSRDANGARLDACAADSEAARDAIERAVRAAGLTGRFSCAIGLGAPSPRWAQAVERAAAALTRLGVGTVTLSDQSVTLVAPHGVDRAAFDRVVGALEADLPDAFSLTARVSDPPQDAGPADAARPEFQVEMAADGAVSITGRLPDARIRQAVGAFSRARFGSQAVTIETRIDPDLPAGWSMRVLAGLEAMSVLHHGRLVMTDTGLELTGVSGNPDATTQATQALSARLGGAEGLDLRIDYDEAFDPVAQEPNPERCEGWVRRALAGDKITFAPGSARLDSASNALLDALAEVLRRCGELPFEVSGHTDSQGRAETNLALSQNRAQAVVDALAARAVLTGSMQVRGYGAERPVADNATEEGREANRRIEFALIRAPADPAAPGDAAAAATEPDPADRAAREAALEIRALTPVADQTRPVARPARGD